MARALWLADALRAEGVIVSEVNGWRTAGSSSLNARGVVLHHTAGPAVGDTASLNTCVNGRSDLPGPLCNVYLSRTGVAYIVASGRANHAGLGGWNGLSGNSSVLGIEAESTGMGDWTQETLDAYPKIVAGMCRVGKIPVANVCGHREWTRRKIDPAGIDLNLFRAQVTTLLTNEEFTMDAEAKKAFAELNARLDQLDKDRWTPTTRRVREMWEKVFGK